MGEGREGRQQHWSWSCTAQLLLFYSGGEGEVALLYTPAFGKLGVGASVEVGVEVRAGAGARVGAGAGAGANTSNVLAPSDRLRSRLGRLDFVHRSSSSAEEDEGSIEEQEEVSASSLLQQEELSASSLQSLLQPGTGELRGAKLARTHSISLNIRMQIP